MITEVRKGNVLDSQAQTLVNTINTVGVMGKGVALEFKKRFPDMYEDYRSRCEAHEVKLGEPYLYRRLVPPWILNFPTKESWRAVSRLSDVEKGLNYLAAHITEWGIESLAVPPLGCGSGQLEWSVVGPTLFRHLNALAIPVEMYAPFEASPDEITLEFLEGRSTPQFDQGRLTSAAVAVAEIVRRLASERYAWPIGHTRFQKLCYFASEAGLPLRLEFEERPYGPFASGLKPLMSRLVNNGVLHERRNGRYVLVEPGPTLADAERRFGASLAEYEPAVAKVADLFLRLNPRRMELAATVHFVATAVARAHDRAPSDNEVIGQVERWKHDKFTRSEITATLTSLSTLSWLHLGATDAIDRFHDEAAEIVA